jgi:nucleoside-diphosphate-sugar epimerase
MRALVVGYRGFVGRHLVPMLAAKGYEVFGSEDFKHSLACEEWEAVANSQDQFTMDNEFDVIVHLGANIVNVNDRMTLGMKAYDDIALDKLVCTFVERYPPTKVFVAMSSCAVDYPDDPYCIVKRTLEAFAGTLHKRGVPVVILRPFSGYGPDQSEEYPFRAIFERALRHEDPLTVWGDGQQVRDWLHIDDLCAGIMTALDDRFPRGVPTELGTGVGTNLCELAEMIAENLGYHPVVLPDAAKASSSTFRVASKSALFRLFTLSGWVARIDLYAGIRGAIDSFKAEGRL